MRLTTTAMAFAATILASQIALAQNQPGTIGSPTAPRGGGTTIQGGTPMAPAATAPAATAPDRNRPPVTTMPAEGANSFTEGQARSRMEAAGYTNVQGLRKDDQGVWRGRAMRNGSQTDVGLDFHGNVVTGNAPVAR
ncbi:MAG: hypothetical protein JWR10_2366 [Rubritepida sp.]|nr:hypothetical protein [Rubritepida sp.]